MDNVHFLLMNLVPKGGTRYALQVRVQISLNLVASFFIYMSYRLGVKMTTLQPSLMAPDLTLGRSILHNHNLPHEDKWYWIGVLVLFLFSFFFNALVTWCLAYLNRKFRSSNMTIILII